MKILLINSVCGIGSTGKICGAIAKEYEKKGYEVKIAYGRDAQVPEEYRKYAVQIGNSTEVKMHALKSKLWDAHGLGSKKATKEFLEWATKYNPDELWLHNIHGYYIHYELLFDWIKSRPKMKVYWTLHDCWAFTGHCAYFSYVGCEKWKSGCGVCPQLKEYPSSLGVDNSDKNFQRKKKAFLGVKDMTLITPSKWLASLVKESFLGQYPIKVSYNTIDHNIFKPTPGNFREKYGIKNKKVVLGVASVWEPRKGLDDFLQLSSMLSDDYAIVLIGLSKKQCENLPKNVIGIERTNNQEELAMIYTTADVFVNPSKEETFGMTTVEALACGATPIVYKGTACEEIVDMYGGIAVNMDINSLYKAIVSVAESGGQE